jgi:exodeoxyribonuclease V alpha subunit
VSVTSSHPEDPKPFAATSVADEEEVEGLVRRVVYRAAEGGFAVVRIELDGEAALLTAVGVLGELREGEHVQLTGRRERHDTHGEQLRVSRAIAAPPRSEAGVRRYLESLPGFGAALAERLVAQLGTAAIEVLETEPWRAAQVRGVGKARAERAGRAALDRKREREVMVFLQGLGVSSAYAARIRKTYGDAAIQRVRENPYRLARDVDGIGFQVADRIARGMGVLADAPERREAALLHALESLADDGHVRAKLQPLYARAETLLADDGRAPDAVASNRALARLALEGAIVGEGDPEVVYLARLHRAEKALAARVLALGGAELVPAPKIPPDDLLSAGQRRALEALASSGVSVLTGGPGTGKTTVLRALVRAWEGARRRVLLAAPTGRAARRLAEASGREALTLHRLLEWGRGGGKSAFARDAHYPLEADLVIVDEASMIDLALARALFEAVPLGARLVLVGDVDQLPSVGPGQVLADLIDSGAVPVARLTEVFRQAEGSGIVDNAYRVLAGEVPVSGTPAPGATADFYVIEVNDANEAERVALRVVTERIPRAFMLDPLRQVQVLAPMHRGAAGTERLNALLADALAGDRPPLDLPARGDRVRAFRLGDKVMQVRNDYDRDVFNGDIGFIREASRDEDGAPNGLVVDFDGRAVAYDLDAIGSLELAYAVSIHKSQGSEYPAVVVTLCAAHHMMLRRNLLYTAVTRGRSLVVLVVEPRALRRAVSDDVHDESARRDTGLAERLRGSR